jgi:hypothetical protein
MTKELSYQKYDESWGVNPIPPVPEEPILAMLQKTVVKNPDKPAVIFLDQATTY